MKITTISASLLALLVTACAKDSTAVTEMSVVMNEFGYQPAAITVPAGRQVMLTFENEGQIEHDFVVDGIDVSAVSCEGEVGGHHMGGDHSEFDLHISTTAGGKSTLIFTPNQAGKYRIFCSVEGHEEAGMVGELIVVSN
ncbi:MAG: hypothetical protein FJZ87_01985 [Chloroflexi bacterium]|nr:hypothetical protein [Chloroflexota bacterium]